MTTDDEIVWARCRAGKKWFWCVWIRWTDTIIAYGRSDTIEECERQAMSHDPAYEEPAGFAGNRRKQLAAIRRKETATSKQQTSSHATVEEFVVVPFDDSESSSFYRHKIVKRTKAKIFVEEDGEACNSDGQPLWGRRQIEGWRAWSIPTIALNREIIERDGSVWHRGSRERYWLSIALWRQGLFNNRNRLPDCLIETLGVQPNVTKQEARTKFKKLLAAAHPDHGGTSEEFQRLHALRREYPSILG